MGFGAHDLSVGMTMLLWALLLGSLFLVLSLHLYRQYWAKRSFPPLSTEEFSGELMKVGETYIARRPARNNCSRTIVCFPGFLENIRYFQELYKDDDAELVLVNNANYHCPLTSEHIIDLSWPQNPFSCGTIEHDGFYLGLVLERLVTGRDIVLHGHSRGGAVVLETGQQYPHLMKTAKRKVSAILEAAVLPKARMAGRGSDPLPHKITSYFLPIALGLMRNASEQRLLKLPAMRPTNPLKTEVCSTMFTASRSYETCVVNVKSIVAWQASRHFDVYDSFDALTIVLGARDAVLNNRTMLASAEQGLARNSGISIIKTENTNHFISLEQPEAIQSIHL